MYIASQIKSWYSYKDLQINKASSAIIKLFQSWFKEVTLANSQLLFLSDK